MICVIPSRLQLATGGLESATQEMASGEERAHAFLDVLMSLPPERRASLPLALAALDRVDQALHDFRQASRQLVLECNLPSVSEPVAVRLREKTTRIQVTA